MKLAGVLRSFLTDLRQIVWPISSHEIKKFLPMALMMMCILFNYNVLRAVKDALVITNIAAEAISFIKTYLVFPSAVIFMLVYSKMTTFLKQETIFYSFCGFFLAFFLCFSLFLYPYRDIIHPDPAVIEHLTTQKLDLYFMTLDLAHFKWFVRIYGQWSLVLFYILSELWGSMMVSLLFWQFANHITKTEEAKRFYPMFGFIGNIGLLIGGFLVKHISKNAGEGMVLAVCIAVSVAILLIFALYHFLNTKILTDPKYFIDQDAKKEKKTKAKVSLMEGFKIVFSSKYLGLIAILVLSYGITMNLVEGPWKAKVKELYPLTNDYVHFMGTLQILTGAISMFAMLLGAYLLKRISWFSGAIITPLILFVSGAGFFFFVVFDELVSKYINTFFLLSPVVLAVMFGLLQNAVSKGFKYAFFDPTKEMAYIPIHPELKTKGKAAVDVVGMRVAKSSGALIQSTLFIIFPLATFVTIAPYLMVIFLGVSILWLFNVGWLSKEYNKQVAPK